MIPSAGRWFWIPILPKWAPPEALAAFPDHLQTRHFSDSGEVRTYLDQRNPGPDHGSAWVAHLDNGVLVMNSRENWDEEQTFDVVLPGQGGRLAGRIRVNTYVMARRTESGLQLQINGRAGGIQSVKLGREQRPQHVLATPPEALTESSWNGQSLLLTISHSGSAVSIDVEFVHPSAEKP
jgi:hypothetical protein